MATPPPKGQAGLWRASATSGLRVAPDPGGDNVQSHTPSRDLSCGSKRGPSTCPGRRPSWDEGTDPGDAGAGGQGQVQREQESRGQLDRVNGHTGHPKDAGRGSGLPSRILPRRANTMALRVPGVSRCPEAPGNRGRWQMQRPWMPVAGQRLCQKPPCPSCPPGSAARALGLPGPRG